MNRLRVRRLPAAVCPPRSEEEQLPRDLPPSRRVVGSSLLVVSAKTTTRRHGKARLDQRLGAHYQVLGQASDHALHPRQSPPRQPPARPSPTQGAALPTWRLSQTEGGVQEVQGGVDAGPGQALDGSLVTGTQQVLTWVPGLCVQSEGGAGRKTSRGVLGGQRTPRPSPDLPTPSLGLTESRVSAPPCSRVGPGGGHAHSPALTPDPRPVIGSASNPCRV